MAKILAINISEKKGVPKTEVSEAVMKEDYGIIGDAHAGKGIRQVSLLANESIDKIRDRITTGLCFGRFAENITTSGIILSTLNIGTKLKLGKDIIIEITQIGKECHNDCEIKRIAGECVMPKEGIFGIVIKGGRVSKGDFIEVIS
jgi:MOSC domain-containing protein YiiM